MDRVRISVSMLEMLRFRFSHFMSSFILDLNRKNMMMRRIIITGRIKALGRSFLMNRLERKPLREQLFMYAPK